jgi:hypothetical protein
MGQPQLALRDERARRIVEASQMSAGRKSMATSASALPRHLLIADVVSDIGILMQELAPHG